MAFCGLGLLVEDLGFGLNFGGGISHTRLACGRGCVLGLGSALDVFLGVQALGLDWISQASFWTD